MHAQQLLHDYFKESLSNMHQVRLNRLLLTSSSLLSHAKLTLSSLGRYTLGKPQVKNKIKAVDRLFANKKLYEERIGIYQAMAKKIIGNLKEIDIIVDWSPAGNHKNHLLKASIALKGRSMTLYEEVHPEKKLGNYKVHQQFLNKLRKVIPTHTKPTIITDAGFRTEWFQLVLLQGWEFEGRIGDNLLYHLKDKEDWAKIKTLYPLGTNKAKHIGNIILTKSNQLDCEAYIYLEKKRIKQLNNHHEEERVTLIKVRNVTESNISLLGY